MSFKNTVKDFRNYCIYLPAWGAFRLLRCLPIGFLRVGARLGACVTWYLLLPFRSIVRQNLNVVYPAMSDQERAAVGRESIYHLIFNMMEYFWAVGDEKRFNARYAMAPEEIAKVRAHAERGEVMIFVSPHFGGWESAGVMAPYFAKIRMTAVAKPVSNPYIHKLLNVDARGRTDGLEFISTFGAMRGAVKALRKGNSLAVLIDQNTRVSDGGIFVDFFGLPVPTSPLPAVLMRYCRSHNIPAVLMYAANYRRENGKMMPDVRELPRKFEEYATDGELIRDCMALTEEYAVRHPAQYLWLYRRFNILPPSAPKELLDRFPPYAFD